MQREKFVAARRERWARLEQLVRQARSGLSRLSGDQILELGQLYRTVTSDLAIARRDFPDDRVTLYLNGLVAGAHPLIYQESAMDLHRIGRFVRYGFPVAYRNALPYIATAFAAFALSALVSAILVAVQPSSADTLLPGTAQELRSVMQQHHLWMQSATENHSVVANFIWINNVTVAFLAFAGGMLVGVLSLYVIVGNGVMLGTIAAMVQQYGLSAPFWAFVAPHGVIELSVIFMAAGAGMMIGDSILRPGLRPRRDALSAAARRAAYVIVGCVPLLIVAGTVEGFFSPSDAPDWSKWLVGLVLGTLLYTYLFLSRPHVETKRYAFAELAKDIDDPASLDVRRRLASNRFN